MKLQAEPTKLLSGSVNVLNFGIYIDLLQPTAVTGFRIDGSVLGVGRTIRDTWSVYVRADGSPIVEVPSRKRRRR